MPRGSVLRIEPINFRRDAAEFECVARNDNGQEKVATATLEVYRPGEGEERACPGVYRPGDGEELACPGVYRPCEGEERACPGVALPVYRPGESEN